MKILTIDIDWLFDKNNSIYEYVIPSNFQKQDTSQINKTNLAFFDLLISKHDNFEILETHSLVLNYISEKDTVCSVDHHHDISYNEFDKISFKYFDSFEYDEEYREAVWAGYAIDQMEIDYVWCKNNNSYIDDFCRQFEYRTIDIEKVIEEDLLYFLRITYQNHK